MLTECFFFVFFFKSQHRKSRISFSSNLDNKSKYAKSITEFPLLDDNIQQSFICHLFGSVFVRVQDCDLDFWGENEKRGFFFLFKEGPRNFSRHCLVGVGMTMCGIWGWGGQQETRHNNV